MLGQLHYLGVRSNVVDTIINCIFEQIMKDVEEHKYDLFTFAKAFAIKFHEHPLFTLSSVKQEAQNLYSQLSLPIEQA